MQTGWLEPQCLFTGNGMDHGGCQVETQMVTEPDAVLLTGTSQGANATQEMSWSRKVLSYW